MLIHRAVRHFQAIGLAVLSGKNIIEEKIKNKNEVSFRPQPPNKVAKKILIEAIKKYPNPYQCVERNKFMDALAIVAENRGEVVLW